MASSDVLVELAIPDIVTLSVIYSQQLDIAAHIYSYLQNVLAWQDKPNAKGLIQVFAPAGEEWRLSGTFISIGHFPWKMLTVFTLDDSCEQLYEALANTNLFDYKKNIHLFYALHEKHLPVVDRAMTKRGLKKISQDLTDLWRLEQHDAILKTPTFSDEYKMEPLKVSDSIRINDVWPHKNIGTENYVRLLIELNGGYGIYTKDDDTLAAWVLKSQLGQLALLQVSEDFQRRGLGQALIYALSKEIAQEGFPALATVVQTNDASQRLFMKCGFSKQFMCAFNVYQ